MSGKQAELDRLRNDLLASCRAKRILRQTKDNIEDAYRRKDLTLLRTYKKFDLRRTSITHIDFCVQVARANNVRHPSVFLTEEHLAACQRMNNELFQWSILCAVALDRAAALDLSRLLFEDLGREERIIALVKERGVLPADDLRVLLDAAEEHPRPLSAGLL